MKRCLSCGAGLVGMQRKYCCRRCKNDFNNQVYQTYVAQQKRGRDRKFRLMAMKGGRCELCGYMRNSAALEFHHVDPHSKSFQLDLRSISNRKWADLEAEAEKCILLCSNCHAECHHPECSLVEG